MSLRHFARNTHFHCHTVTSPQDPKLKPSACFGRRPIVSVKSLVMMYPRDTVGRLLVSSMKVPTRGLS